MDIGVSAVSTAYVPAQAYSPQGGAAVASQMNPASSNNTQQQPLPSLTASQSDLQSKANSSNLQSASSRQTKNTSNQNAASQTSEVANFTFEVDRQNHRIMKLSDGNGVLIYQIPSKGQLALITAQENDQKRLALVA